MGWLFWLVLMTMLLDSGAQRDIRKIQSPASYMVLYPNYIKFETSLVVYVKMLRPIQYEKIDVTIISENSTLVLRNGTEEYDHFNETLATGTLTLSQGTQEGKIEIKMPKRNQQNRYNRNTYIHVKGSGTLQFDNSSTLQMQYYSYGEPETNEYILIQTDKAIYKTGQTVRYRVFVIDKNMKPLDVAMDISIQDGQDHRLHEQSNVNNKFGISGELPLSEHPPLGSWKVRVKLRESGKIEYLHFDVKEYVLPKFEVQVKLPPFGTVDKPELKGTVLVKYTYGKPVKGRVILTVSKKYAGYWAFYEPRAIRTEFDIDGEADFNIAMKTLLKFDPNLKHDTLRVVANVTETATGNHILGEGEVTFHEQTIQLQTMYDQGDYFKPGFKFPIYIKVTQPDGRPIARTSDRVKAEVTYFTRREMTVPRHFQAPTSPSANLMEFISPFHGGSVMFLPEMYLSVPQDGMIKFELDIPEHVATAHVEFNFRDKRETKNIQRFRTVSKAYLNLNMKSSNVKVGEQAVFMLSSNIVPRSRITYHLIKDQRIIETHYTSVNSAFRPTTFYVKMTPEMLPQCNIIAYFYHAEYEEVIADGLQFSVDMAFENDVSLNFDKGQVAPGTNVSLHMKADPGSQIFALAVDKSVILKKTGNDITQHKISQKFNLHSRPSWKYQSAYIPRRLSANDVHDIFKASGYEVLSDVHFNDIDLYQLAQAGNGAITDYRFQSGMGFDITECRGSNCVNTVGAYSASMPVPVRQKFPETWIWANETVGPSGIADLYATVPDTITDWVATAFAINEETGIGVAPIASNVTVYLPFFVTLHLPFSIISGEVVLIQALVFNYYSVDMYVTVKLRNSSNEFVGMVIDRQGKEQEELGDMEKCLLVKANDVESAYFTLKALTVGTINLEVEAASPRGKDTIRRQLIVKSPGKQLEDNIAKLVTLEENTEFHTQIPIYYPRGIVKDSERVRISVIGDVFGPSMENLDQLIQIPSGCGEQNMVRFAPAVYAAAYLNTTNRYTGVLRDRVVHALTTGYQRELLYQRYDGSFSAFGNADKEGSLWLSCFVLKTFAQASKLIYIDPEVINKTVKFVLKHQNSDGSFNMTGVVHHKAMQGGSVKTKKSLAAYVLLALTEVQHHEILNNATEIKNLSKAILSTWSFLNTNIDRMTDDYELAITAYALKSYGSSQRESGGVQKALQKLENSPNKEEKDNTKYWRDDVKSHSVEIAAYVLLTHASYGDENAGLPVLKWLIQQRSAYGGFYSTQDTVVALDSLAAFASIIFSANVNMTVHIYADRDYAGNVTLNTDTMDILQFIDVSSQVFNVEIEAEGTGLALVEISTFYNVLEEVNSGSFELTVTTNATDAKLFDMEVCTRWLDNEDSGMVLMDIAFPSGYVRSNPEYRPISNNEYSRFEMDNGRLVVYFDTMLPTTKENSTCVKVKVTREATVGKVQPAVVRVFSYYDTDKSAMAMYLPEILKTNNICDVCGVICGCSYDSNAIPKERCLTGSRSRVIQPYRQSWQPNLYGNSGNLYGNYGNMGSYRQPGTLGSYTSSWRQSMPSAPAVGQPLVVRSSRRTISQPVQPTIVRSSSSSSRRTISQPVQSTVVRTSSRRTISQPIQPTIVRTSRRTISQPMEPTVVRSRTISQPVQPEISPAAPSTVVRRRSRRIYNPVQPAQPTMARSSRRTSVRSSQPVQQGGVRTIRRTVHTSGTPNISASRSRSFRQGMLPGTNTLGNMRVESSRRRWN